MKTALGFGPLDLLLGGGIESGIVTCAYGGAGAGKTNLSILFSRACAPKGTVVYIDTEGGLSGERMNQVISDKGLLKKILVKRVNDFSEQKNAIKKINIKISGIVVDSLTMLYRLENPETANRELAKQMQLLSGLAHEKNVPVLITNQCYVKDGKVRPVAGDVLRYWPKTILFLEKIRGNGRKITLEKHRSRPCGESCTFKICNSGFCGDSWSL